MKCAYWQSVTSESWAFNPNRRISWLWITSAITEIYDVRGLAVEEQSMEMHKPAHPGAVLKEWLADISATAAAERLGVSRLSLSKVLNENGASALTWTCGCPKPWARRRGSGSGCRPSGTWHRLSAVLRQK